VTVRDLLPTLLAWRAAGEPFVLEYVRLNMTARKPS